MTPSLAKRGRLVVASGASFIVVGALSSAAPLVALGGVVIAAILSSYLWFYPAAILLRRRKVETSWWLPPGDLPGGALSVDRPLPLHLALRNHGGRRLRVLRLEILGTSGIVSPDDLEALMLPGKQVEIQGKLRALHPGYHVLHGVVLHFGDILGLFHLRAYFPNSMSFKVFPSLQANLAMPLQPPQSGALHQVQGLHQVRRRGLAGELRELREHQHGDPFKNIAWKATARRRKLMVRDLENELVLTHQYLLDMGGSMRAGQPGQSKLDMALHLVGSLSKLASESGDRAGLITFDSRVFSQLPPADGHQHHLRIIDKLVETHNVVDEDLTDLTNSELVACIGRYLAHQEAVDCRLHTAPPLEDPVWEHIQAAPNGELYDLKALSRVATKLLAAMESSAKRKGQLASRGWSEVKIDRDSPALMAELRRFARLRGVELPYRSDHEFGRRSSGFTAALKQVAAGPKTDSCLLISDLDGMLHDRDEVAKAIVRARRKARFLVAIVPFAPHFAPEPLHKNGVMVAQVLRREAEARLEQSRQFLLQQGIQLIAVGPKDTPLRILEQVARAKRGSRRSRGRAA